MEFHRTVASYKGRAGYQRRSGRPAWTSGAIKGSRGQKGRHSDVKKRIILTPTRGEKKRQMKVPVCLKESRGEAKLETDLVGLGGNGGFSIPGSVLETGGQAGRKKVFQVISFVSPLKKEIRDSRGSPINGHVPCPRIRTGEGKKFIRKGGSRVKVCAQHSRLEQWHETFETSQKKNAKA